MTRSIFEGHMGNTNLVYKSKKTIARISSAFSEREVMIMSSKSHPSQSVDGNRSDNEANDFDSDGMSSINDDEREGALSENEIETVPSTSTSLQETLFAGIGNIAAACDAVNSASKKRWQSKEAKVANRRLANRLSAKMSRERKKMESDALQEKSDRLFQENLELKKENENLKQQVAFLLKSRTVAANPDETIGGFGGPMMGRLGHQDLLTMSAMHLHTHPINLNHTILPQGTQPQTPNIGYRSVMDSCNTALMQGADLVHNALQLRSDTMSHNQLGIMPTPRDASESITRFDSGDVVSEVDSRKRR